MISRLQGRLRAYWYEEGYIRTSSHEYRQEKLTDIHVHLTNDAIQRGSKLYGRHESGNKLSYAEFQKYVDGLPQSSRFNFKQQIEPQMKSIAVDAIKSVYFDLDDKKLDSNFEIFGLDFLIDERKKVWLL